MPSEYSRERNGGIGRQPPVRKSLGQHFLHDRNILERIVQALDLTGDETVVEIGPGRGALTDLLVPRARRLILVEYDRALAAMLSERYAAHASVSVIARDVLAVPLSELTGGDPYVLIGNLPYYLTSPILFHSLERPRAARSVFLVQREVADRIVAKPSTPAYGALSVNIQSLTSPTFVFEVKAGAFTPRPRVDSAVVRWQPRAEAAIGPEHEQSFGRFVQAAFGFRRKQLRRVLRTLLDRSIEEVDELLSRTKLTPTARPETLGPEEFARLFRAAGEPDGLTRGLPKRS